MNIKNITATLLMALVVLPVAAAKKDKNAQTADYRRSSIYSVMINHTDKDFATEIREAFMKMETPDKYNDHDLSVKVLQTNIKLQDANKDRENVQLTNFLNDNQVASRLVGKWFNRDKFTGQCDMNLIKERGLYNASEFDRELASRSARSEALLMDAGEDLIGNTFVLVNDINYIDRNKGAKTVGGILRFAGALMGAMSGNTQSNDSWNQLGDLAGSLAETFKGFKVKINTFLYQLVWDEATAATFYKEQYADAPDNTKRDNFDRGRGRYKLKFVGKVESSGNTTSFLGIKEEQPQLMVLKACQRALDENIVDLQSQVEAFRTKVPLNTTEPLTAYVGLKEGVSKKSKFEVLEIQEDAQGKKTYKRVGVITPVESLIWDNRFMAEEEGAANATLGFTTFKKVSGGDFFPGMLIREIK